MKRESLVVRFNFEHGDPSVGIGESFTAEEEGGKYWCEMEVFTGYADSCRFGWYWSASGDPVVATEAAPPHKRTIEALLFSYVSCFYEDAGCFYTDTEDDDDDDAAAETDL